MAFLFVVTPVVFRFSCFHFIFIVIVSAAKAFQGVLNKKSDEAMFLKLPEMAAFMVNPALIGKKFCPAGVMEMNCFPDHHGHPRAAEFPCRDFSEERVFFYDQRFVHTDPMHKKCRINMDPAQVFDKNPLHDIKGFGKIKHHKRQNNPEILPEKNQE